MTRVRFLVTTIITGLALLAALAVFRPSAIRVPTDESDVVVVYAHASFQQSRPRNKPVHVAVNVEDANYYSEKHWQEVEVSVQVTTRRGDLIEAFVTQLPNEPYYLNCWFSRPDSPRRVGVTTRISPQRVECRYRSQ